MVQPHTHCWQVIHQCIVVTWSTTILVALLCYVMVPFLYAPHPLRLKLQKSCCIWCVKLVQHHQTVVERDLGLLVQHTKFPWVLLSCHQFPDFAHFSAGALGPRDFGFRCTGIWHRIPTTSLISVPKQSISSVSVPLAATNLNKSHKRSVHTEHPQSTAKAWMVNIKANKKCKHATK